MSIYDPCRCNPPTSLETSPVPVSGAVFLSGRRYPGDFTVRGGSPPRRSLVAATAFTGCSDDDDKSLTPKLTADPTALDFTDETATTQTVAITANCEWTVTASNLDWATISPMSGKGNGTISVTVSELPAGTNLREGKISFTLIHPEFGKWGQAESSVAVKQYGSGVTPPPTGDAIYANDFDKEQAQKGSDNKFPFADAFEGWKNQTGTGADNVAYKTSGISVRSNSPSNDSHSKYKDDASGVNNMFFGTSGVFEIQKIALESTQKNLQLTFGSYRSIFEDKDNAFKTSEFHVYLSKDGENWAEITYDRPVGDDEHSNYGTWALATANFTLKQVPSELYIKFTSDLTSAHRIDDVKLFEGIGGTEVDLDNITPPVTETKTIAEVIAGSVGATYTTQGQVVAINGRSFLIQDNSGKILVYLGWKDNKPVVDYSATIGQTVKVTGKTTTYSKLVQFSETDLVIEKVSDGSFTQPTPEKFDGAAFDAYAAATPVIKYIEYSGTLTIDGYYYNIAVDGTDLQGSLAYPADGFVDASLNGQVVIVKGYTLGMTNQSKMLSTIAVSVEKDGDAPAEPKITKLDPTSLSFAATDNAKTVTVTAANADDCTIEAATDKSEQFTTSVDGMLVTVTPKENTTEQAITATLTIKLMKAGAAVDTKTVAISQAGKIVGSGYVRVTSITSGKKYLIVAENGDKYAVLPASAGLNASKLFDGIAITVANGKIEANAANNAHAVTIVASDGAYTIQNTAGKFIEYANNSSGKTQLAIVDTSSRKWVADEETAGTFLIKDSEVTGRALLYRNGDTEYDNRFGGYATSNIGKGYINLLAELI